MAEVTIPSWPSTLPQAPLIAAYSESTKSLASVVTTGNKSAIIRRNTTRSQTPMKIAFNFTKEQVAFFETFFYDTLGGGIRIFSFTHPRKKTTIEVSFDPSQEEVYTIEPQDNMSFFKITMQLLVWN